MATAPRQLIVPLTFRQLAAASRRILGPTVVLRRIFMLPLRLSASERELQRTRRIKGRPGKGTGYVGRSVM